MNPQPDSPTPPHHEPPQDAAAALRIIDAAANRAGEGLRVVEDYLRLALDDPHLTGQCKRLRHDLAALLAAIPDAHRLACRDAAGDVGAPISTPGEMHRGGVADVATAGFKRVEQALRSLEEYTKVLHSPAAAMLESLRFRTYALERAVALTAQSCRRLDAARLYLIVDGRDSLDRFTTLVRSLVEAGVHVIQLRDKRLDDRTLLERARRLAELTRDSGTLFIMNDRPDLARLARADGVHVGQEELTVNQVRTIVGPRPLIGVSTHTIEQARRAVLDGANYLGCGPVFPSSTKTFDALAGVELLRAVSAQIALPAFAVGGITAENLADVLAAGFRRVALGGAIVNSPDPAATARELLSALKATPVDDSNP